METAELLAPGSVMARVLKELAGMFVGVFSAETVGRYVVESEELLAREARIRSTRRT